MRLLRTLDRMPGHFRADENVILFGDVALVFSVIIGRHGSGEPESVTHYRVWLCSDSWDYGHRPPCLDVIQ